LGVLVTPAICLADQRIQAHVEPPGTFREDQGLAGSFTWSGGTEGGQIPEANFDFLFVFQAGFRYQDPDNIPVAPAVSDLTLIGWPAGFPQTLPWTFEHMSSSLDGPLDTWAWLATVVVHPGDPRPVLTPGVPFATATWTTGGDDVDNLADLSSFSAVAFLPVMMDLEPSWLTWAVDRAEVALNPEPVPEPATLALLAIGGVWATRRTPRSRGR
jgi:hypothetical protein